MLIKGLLQYWREFARDSFKHFIQYRLKDGENEEKETGFHWL